jgi:hypothetical protein
MRGIHLRHLFLVEMPTHSNRDIFPGKAPRPRHQCIITANLIPHGYIVRYRDGTSTGS